MKELVVVGSDWGASGGKMGKGTFNGNVLKVSDYIDLDNKPVRIPNALYWDVFGIYRKLLDGISYYASENTVASVAVDTWGASYGLLDSRGRLLEPVYHYRDVRTDFTMNKMHNQISQEELFAYTGCQCNKTYTLPQLYSYIEYKTQTLGNAESLLFLPDLLSYFLSGEKNTEKTIAGTSGLLDTSQEEWCWELIDRIGLPRKIFTSMVDAGTIQGALLPCVQEETRSFGTKVVSTVGHDSAAAVAAIPGFGKEKLYISIGTNISMGIETDYSLVTKAAYEIGLKNTGGIGRSNIVYRDFSAFWLLNELRRVWASEGKSLTYSEIIALARCANSNSVVDIEEPEFNNTEGDIRIKINEYLRRTKQTLLQTDGEFIRCIFESITLKVKAYAEAISKELNCRFEEVFVINGGSRNDLLVQMISDALGRPVKAGMPYATIAGNILTQLLALGEVNSVEEMRMISAKSFEMTTYTPEAIELEKWNETLIKIKE